MQNPGPAAPTPPAEPWIAKNGVALLSAVFSFFGACLAGWVTIQTHGTDARVADLQRRNTNAQNFEQRVFENVDKLLNKNREASRLYLIGLYGQARDDPANKLMVASIAAASCNKDLVTTLTTLINSNDKDKQEFQKDGFANSLDAWNSLCVVAVSSPPPGSTSHSKVVEATPPPETVKARAVLIASLTPPGATGWVKIGSAPLGTESKQCVDVKLEPPSSVKMLGPPPPCQPIAAGRLAVPRDIKENPRSLQALAATKLYQAADETSSGIGIATPNSTLQLLDNVKGVDVYDAHGRKTGYSVWANVALQAPVISDIPTPAPIPSATSEASASPAASASPNAPKPQTTP